MKPKLTGSLLSLLIVGSCATKVVRPGETDQIDSKVRVGNTYTFKKLDGSRAKFKVSKVDATTILGTDLDLKSYNLQRNQVASVNKSNTLGTVLIAAGVAAAVITIPAYSKNEPVGGR